MKDLDEQAPFILRKLLAMINHRYSNLHHFARVCGINYVSLWKMFKHNSSIDWRMFRVILKSLDTTEEEFCSGIEFAEPCEREVFALMKKMTPRDRSVLVSQAKAFVGEGVA